MKQLLARMTAALCVAILPALCGLAGAPAEASDIAAVASEVRLWPGAVRSPATFSGSFIDQSKPAQLAFLSLDWEESLTSASAQWMETFDQAALARDWIWMREERSDWDAAIRPGYLRVHTRPQTIYFTAPNNQQNILLRRAPPGDFTLTTRVEFEPSHNFQQAALIVYRSDDNFVLIDRGFCDQCPTGGNGVYFDSEGDGVPEFSHSQAYAASSAYLRIRRAGSSYLGSYSTDGLAWTVLGQVDRPDLTNVLVGLSATNANTDAAVPSAHADFDFIRLDSSTYTQYLPIMLRPAGEPKPIIVDDDGSTDGVIALLYFLLHPDYDVRAITVSNGIAHTHVFAQNLLGALALVDRTGIPVAAGRSSPLVGDNAFPDPWREGSDDFWGIALPEPVDQPSSLSAAELIVRTVNGSTRPVTVFASGPLTNLAEALRIDPGIVGNIDQVQIMGGAVYAQGNIKPEWPAIDNVVAEWNIWADAVAASEVLSSGLSLRFVPLDATNQVKWSWADAAVWEASGVPEATLAARLLRLLLGWGLEKVWDLTAAVDLTDPVLSWADELHLEVSTEEGTEQGKTTADTQMQPNAWVCLIPRHEEMRLVTTSVFGSVQ
jgi:pyrimidine-specific ribonucleoside hydrolase